MKNQADFYDVMNSSEKKIFELRRLYASQGYVPYKMSKFEEYDLYGKNRDFLVSDRVITFTDTNGKLMALKPDVTLSIIKNNINSNKQSAGKPLETQKLYYNENVYRVSDSTDSFKEIMQVGIECIGYVNSDDITQTLSLAVQSLVRCGSSCIIGISDLDILSAAINNASDSKDFRKQVNKCIEDRNAHGIAKLCDANSVAEPAKATLIKLAGLHGSVGEALPQLEELAAELGMSEEAESFGRILTAMDEAEMSRIIVDFSIIGDFNYYNGIIFKGWVQGVPAAVLSGGQYDGLLRRMKHGAKGIGFAINMDALEIGASVSSGEREYINVALPKGRLGEKAYDIFEKAGYDCPSIKEDNRKLVFENAEKGIRFMWAKPSDVAIYVERGATDIGICGKDILMEHEPDVFELADLGLGKCRMTVSGPKDFKDDKERALRVATKFTRTARNYYASLGRDIDIIQLNGSIEIAPILGLSDVIVDIVETGKTLKENNLEVKEEIYPISARLIANKSSFKFKNAEIEKILAAILEVIE